MESGKFSKKKKEKDFTDFSWVGAHTHDASSRNILGVLLGLCWPISCIPVLITSISSDVSWDSSVIVSILLYKTCLFIFPQHNRSQFTKNAK